MRLFCGLLLALLAILLPSHRAFASFHLMQIEQVIGGVNGDTTAQAVQLRMRSSGQNLVSQARLVVVDATGSNPILLENMTTNVPNGQSGRRVLLTTPNFANYTNIPLVTDFVMDPIPASYLAAGQLRFTDDSGSIWWSLSWGGAGYTGSTLGLGGAGTNDSDGNFGPPVNVALPSTTLQALQFTGAASALSTENLAQYAVTAGAATFVNNAGTSFVVTAPPPPVTPGDFNDDGVVDTADYVVWKKTEGTNFDLGGNGDEMGASMGVVDGADYALWVANFGETAAGTGGGASVPEPASMVLFVAVIFLAAHRPRRGIIQFARRPLLRRRDEA
jgi:hypothetical protein